MSFRYYHRPLKRRCVSALDRFKPQFTVVLSNITCWCCMYMMYLFNDGISMIDYWNFVDFGHLWQFSPSSWDKGEITHQKNTCKIDWFAVVEPQDVTMTDCHVRYHQKVRINRRTFHEKIVSLMKGDQYFRSRRPRYLPFLISFNMKRGDVDFCLYQSLPYNWNKIKYQTFISILIRHYFLTNNFMETYCA